MYSLWHICKSIASALLFSPCFCFLCSTEQNVFFLFFLLKLHTPLFHSSWYCYWCCSHSLARVCTIWNSVHACIPLGTTVKCVFAGIARKTYSSWRPYHHFLYGVCVCVFCNAPKWNIKSNRSKVRAIFK